MNLSRRLFDIDYLQRKANTLRTTVQRRLSATVALPNQGGILTIYHDYERHYHLPEVAQASDNGVARCLAIERKYQVQVTYNIVGKLMDDVPETVAAIIADGHELACHSDGHRTMTRLSRKEMEAEIVNTKERFTSLGLSLRGFRSPQSRWSFRQMDLLLKHQLQWSAENDPAPFPYLLRRRGASVLVRMPIMMDDWAYEAHNIAPQEFLDRLIACVDEIHHKKRFGAIGFHPWVQGIDERRLKVFDRFIDYAKHHKKVQILPFCAVYEAYMKAAKPVARG